MQFSCPRHHHSKNSFGFKPNRLIFFEDAPEGRVNEEVLKEIDILRKDDSQAEQVKTLKDVYNGYVRTNKHVRRNQKKLSLALTPNGDIQISESLSRVDAILKNKDLDLDRYEKDALENIRKELEGIQTGRKTEMEKAAKVDQEKRVKESSDLLLNISGRSEKMQENEASWKNRQAFVEIAGIYDSVAEGDRDYKTLWQNEVGNFDQMRASENRKLFLAIMERATDGFTKDISTILDPKNYEANIEKFPYLYQTWVKIKNKDVMNDIETYEKRLQNLQLTNQLKDILDVAGKNAGISFQAIEDIPNKPDIAYWEKRASVIQDNIAVLRKKADEDPADPRVDAGRLKDAATELEAHLTHAKLNYSLARKRGSLDSIKKEFTGEHMRHPKNRKNFIEAMLTRYQKAVETVEQRAGGGSWRDLYHPSIRRLLIANAYENGDLDKKPSESGSGWMLEMISSSRYFDSKVRGQSLGPAERAVLEVAYIGGEVAKAMDNAKKESSLIAEMLEFNKLSGAEADKAMRSIVARYPASEVSAHKLPNAILSGRQAQIEKDNKKRGAFLAIAAEVIKNPYDKEGKPNAALLKLDSDGDGHLDKNVSKMTLLNPGDLALAEKRLYGVESSYMALELESRIEGEQNNDEVLKQMEINMRGLYQNYVVQVQKHPEMNTRNWGELLSQEGDPDALADFLEKIISPGTTVTLQSGKKALIEVLRSMDDIDEPDYKLRESRRVAKSLVLRIKGHIEENEVVRAGKMRQMPEVLKKLKGAGINEKVEETFEMIKSMALSDGPLFSLERIGGVGAIYALIKLLGKAKRFESPSDKAAGVAMLGLIANALTKRATGHELIEHLGLNTISEAAEGTHEEVLADHGKKRMEGIEGVEGSAISKEEHLRALFALNKAPFHKVMAWYKSSDKNGSDYLTGESSQEELRLFNETGIKTGNIMRGAFKGPGAAIRERYILREVVTHLGEFVGGDDQSPEDALKGLEEVWVTSVENPGYIPQHSDVYFPELAERFHGRQNELTWQYVVEAEVSAHQVKETINQNGLTPMVEGAKEWAEDMQDWVRQGFFNPGEGYAEVFFESMGETADEAVELLGNWASDAHLELQFFKKKVEFMYNNKKWELKRLGEGVWGIFVSGVTLPVKVIYGGLNTVIPWVDTKMRQATEILRSDSLSPTKSPEGVFSALDIADESRAWQDAAHTVLSPDLKKNPEFKFYGLFQKAFLEAYKEGPVNENHAIEGAKYYKEVDDIGYSIIEVNHKSAGIDMNNPMFSSNPENRYGHMQAVAREEAVKFFISQDIPQAYIEKFMYPIHTVLQTKPSESVVVFFRLPRPESKEGILMAEDRWVDSMNPNDYKDTAPIMFEAGDTTWEKLKKASGLRYDTARKAFSVAGKYGVQPLYLWRASMEAAGYTAKFIAEMFLAKEYEHKAAWMGEIFKTKESTNQYLDEATTAASNSALASSEFYKDPENAMIFDLAHEYMLDRKQSHIYLGIFKNGYVLDHKGKIKKDDDGNQLEYEGRSTEKPQGYSNMDFMAFYRDTWLEEMKRPEIGRLEQYMAGIPEDDQVTEPEAENN